MASNLVQQVISDHRVSGEMWPGKEVAIHIDQLLTQDATGAAGEFECDAKDIIFELLRRLTVKGGVGRIIEYGGPGVADLSVPERGTITNMGAELGATTSIFPSDEQTQSYMKAQGREQDWQPFAADKDA